MTGTGGSQIASATVTVFSGIRYYAYIPDYFDKKIRIIDTNTGIIQKSIDITGTTTNLQGVSAESSGVYTYIAESGSTRIIKIDPLTMTKADELAMTANFQGKPKHIALAPDGCYLYTTSSVPLWNPASGKYVGTISAIKTSEDRMASIRGISVELPHQISLEGLTVSPDNSHIFVADPDNNNILVLDAVKMHRYAADIVTISDELITTIPIATPPLGISYSSNGQFLYVFADNTIYEIDALNLVVNRSVTVPNGNRFMKVHPDGSRIYIVTREYLSIVETAGFTKTATKSIAGLYNCMGFDIHPDGSRLFFADKSSDKLITVDSSTYQVIFNTTIGADPAAYGSFLGHLPITISGNVTQNGSRLNGATLTLNGEGILRTRQTATAGDFLFGLKPGDYQLIPSMSNLAFTPESMILHVTESQTGLDFSVSGIVPPPTVTLTSSSTWVDPYETFTLNWDSTGADYVTIEVVTSAQLPPSGSRNFSLQSTTTIWASAYNRGGYSSASIKIYVASTDPPTATISANPALIQSGRTSTLTWSTTRAATVTIDNGIGTVAAAGSKIVSPCTTTTYTVTNTHANGYKVMASTTVTVNEFDTTAKLIGTVTDFAIGQPIANVSVSSTDASGIPKTVLTNILGKYLLTDLCVGDITVSFSKTGYDPIQQTVHIPSGTTFDLTTQLHATLVGATLEGIVKDGLTNKPLAGTLISATQNSGETISCTSTIEGLYSIAGLPLQVPLTITASAADYYPSTIQNTFSQNAASRYDFTIFPISAVAKINGTILNSRNMQPEAGVRVCHQESGKKAISGADGIFTLEGVPFGPGNFFFHKDNFISKIYSMDIGQTILQWNVFEPTIFGKEIKLGTRFSGVVLDSFTQQPLRGAVVRVIGQAIQNATDENGRFNLSGIDPGSCNISVTSAHHSAFQVHALIDETNPATFDFLLHPISFGTIKGKIVGADGAPVQGVQIGLSTGGIISARTGYDGMFEISAMPLGIYTMEFVHPCFEKTSRTISISHEGETHETMVSLMKRPALGKLSGRITDRSTRAGIGNASVTITANSAMTITDDQGRFSIAEAPLGVIQLAVAASGYLPRNCERFVEVQWDNHNNTTIAQDIELKPESSANYTTTIQDELEPVSVIIEAAAGGSN